MPDNVVSNPGTGGPTWATDEIGGVHYSRQKLVHGADGVAFDASAANPLPVVQTGTPALPTGAATDAVVLAVGAAVAVVAGHVDGLEAATGAQADAAAAADGTGNYSLIAAAKRALLNWATLLARIPALVGGRVPVQATATAGTLTDRSGTIAAGNTAQALMGANAARMGFSVQNLGATDLWINTSGTAAAAQPSMQINPGGYFETPPGFGAVAAVSVFSATTGHPYSAREW